MLSEPLKVLLVEDNSPDELLFRHYLGKPSPFRPEIAVCRRVAEVESLLSQKHPAIDVVLLDLGLPDSQGFETFTRVRRLAPDLPIVVLTGQEDEELALQALREGAQDYLDKSQIDGALLRRSLHYAVERMRIAKDLRQARDELEHKVGELALANDALKKMVKQVSKAGEKLHQALQGIIQTISMTIETRDPYTAGHQRGVANLAVAIAQRLGLAADRIEGLRLAATVHDLGKISIPAEILAKPARLTEVESSMIRTHPRAGYEILKRVDFPWPIAQMVLQHHERLDGSGYPQGLRADEILLEAKILGVADVVDAMCSHRPYRAARGLDKVLAEISQHRGILYDPAVVDACLQYFHDSLAALPTNTKQPYKSLITHQPRLPALL